MAKSPSVQGVFVTGTDTNIGKTLVCAWLVHHWRAGYWKPVQTGATEDSDSATVAKLAPAAIIHPPAYVFQAPLSPHEAARREGARIELSGLKPPATPGPLVVEGAGGILVPLNEVALTIDFMEMLNLPVVVVARSGLGTINHTLLTLDALRRRHIPVLGVVLNGQKNPANRQAIEHFGSVRVLAEIQPLPAVTPALVASLPPPDFSCPPDLTRPEG
ncbi:Dethiobiotin synthetase [Magnetospirillum gryphiswaldense MSR-1 v2]|uniref:ATP-dependent dethiobiotin synthetase BioD n=1 Tax=Magnetospirillum gryphiswaldense (strain DSM 6361 / JCM 21280 / NBRC 15271 / MSR-1) TaxID=431944 RepID=V6F0W8_MAGGM|nr:dethiobiotin synthase [Magnetospirillum gryphiswaldense]CDK98143.1 Dethiobiotin synthetase [Magnetospirillum gryphiswaldense MSR-1 v2]